MMDVAPTAEVPSAAALLTLPMLDGADPLVLIIPIQYNVSTVTPVE